MSYSPVAGDNRFTSGSFLMSSNARPVPRVGIGFFDYVKLPFTHSNIGIIVAIYD